MVRECTEEPAKIKWASTNVIEFQWLSSFLLASMTASTNNITEFCGIRFLRPHFFLFRSAFYLFKYAIDQRELCSSLYNFVFFLSSLLSLSLQRIVPVCFKIEFLSSYRRKKAKSTRKWAEKCENLFSVHRHFFSFHIITLAHIKCLFKIFLLYFCANVNDVERCNNAREPHNIFHPFNRNKCDVKIVMEIEWLGRFSFSLFSTLTAPSAKIVFGWRWC